MLEPNSFVLMNGLNWYALIIKFITLLVNGKIYYVIKKIEIIKNFINNRNVWNFFYMLTQVNNSL